MKEVSRDGRHRARRLTSAPCSAARNVLFYGFLISQTAPRVRFLVVAVLQKGKSRPGSFLWAIPQVRGGICWRYHPWNPAQEFGVASRCVFRELRLSLGFLEPDLFRDLYLLWL